MIPVTARVTADTIDPDSMDRDSMIDLLRADINQADAQSCRVRTQRSMGTSTVIHILLLSWLVLLPKTGSETSGITEITLLEPGELSLGGSPGSGPNLSAPAAPAPRGAARIGPETPGYAVAHSADVSFRRRADESVSPTQQNPNVFADRLEARLSALQAGAASPTKGVAVASIAPAPLWGTAPVPASGTGDGSGGTAPIELKRGAGGTGGGGRGGSGTGAGNGRGPGYGEGGSGAGPALAVPKLPAVTAEAAKPASETKSAARRELAGMKLMGPIADRAVIHYAVPQYPDWAKREGIEGSVTLYFVVLADGQVKENVMVQKTAGFEDFDQNAIAALRTWKFEPLRRGQTGEQWGTITIHYRLTGA